ncbi:MAG: tRNA (adenosine(37)-N6)-threonylcarbamoyltransferase complex dimerization subunit type 1 TsaB [Actinomycetota bacterium]|nr:tRNA (adenosine(37)-N6)-threonylcarbamoyltransferase complex dimerization subunit type 1 TsaB [Actinomycetota bacterium]
MRVLGFDTATRATSVAAVGLEGDGELFEAHDHPGPEERPRHTGRLLPLIVDVMHEARWDWRDVDLIAVGIGPGTFTGLRIGIATARALARSREIPLVGVSTLQSLALAATSEDHATGVDAILAVLDARRREVYAAAWAPDQAHKPEPDGLLAPQALAPEALAQASLELGARRLAAGDGAVAFRSVLAGWGVAIPGDDSALHRVNAIYHCRLAGRTPRTSADDVAPQYLRAPDAKPRLIQPAS